MAHEVKNALAGARAVCTITPEGKPLTPEQRDVVLDSLSLADAIMDATCQDAALTDTGDLPEPVLYTVQLHSILDYVLRSARAYARDKNPMVECALALDGELPAAWVMARPKASLMQVLLNIVTNAVKYSSHTERSSVVIAARYFAGTGLVVAVEDKGIGMDETTKLSFMQAFQRGSHTNGTQGMGVGMVLSKKQTTDLRGRMLFCSSAGEGTVATVVLPPLHTIADIEAVDAEYGRSGHPVQIMQRSEQPSNLEDLFAEGRAGATGAAAQARVPFDCCAGADNYADDQPPEDDLLTPAPMPALETALPGGPPQLSVASGRTGLPSPQSSSARSDSSLPTMMRTASAMATVAQLSVLVVEDSAVSARMLQVHLRRCGVKGRDVRVVTTGEEAVELMRPALDALARGASAPPAAARPEVEVPFRVVICDNQLEGELTGVEVGQALGPLALAGHIYLVASSADSGAHAEFAQAGFHQALTKPLGRSDVLSALRSAVQALVPAGQPCVSRSASPEASGPPPVNAAAAQPASVPDAVD